MTIGCQIFTLIAMPDVLHKTAVARTASWPENLCSVFCSDFCSIEDAAFIK
jgi:hypothetical protein